jgi:hypothetical protein
MSQAHCQIRKPNTMMPMTQIIGWMLPRNTARHHKANATDEKQIGAQMNKPRKKQHASNSHQTCAGTAPDTFGKHDLRKPAELSIVPKYQNVRYEYRTCSAY